MILPEFLLDNNVILRADYMLDDTIISSMFFLGNNYLHKIELK